LHTACDVVACVGGEFEKKTTSQSGTVGLIISPLLIDNRKQSEGENKQTRQVTHDANEQG